jgi:hypothetical protein
LWQEVADGGAAAVEQGEVASSLSSGTHFWFDEDADGQRGVAEYWDQESEFLDRVS